MKTAYKFTLISPNVSFLSSFISNLKKKKNSKSNTLCRLFPIFHFLFSLQSPSFWLLSQHIMKQLSIRLRNKYKSPPFPVYSIAFFKNVTLSVSLRHLISWPFNLFFKLILLLSDYCATLFYNYFLHPLAILIEFTLVCIILIAYLKW